MTGFTWCPLTIFHLPPSYWDQGHRFSPGVATLAEDSRGVLQAYFSGPGWDTGNGTLQQSGEVTLSVYSDSKLHARLEGTMSSDCTSISWDNNSTWCRRGSANCGTLHDRFLADYGGADNLLECVPTYIHKVAALNAANAW
jgi:hypothetical protein